MLERKYTLSIAENIFVSYPTTFYMVIYPTKWTYFWALSATVGVKLLRDFKNIFV